MKKKPTTKDSPSPATSISAVTKAQTTVLKEALPPSHKDIATQAVKIWRDKSCPKGCDVEIWLEAEGRLTGKAVPPCNKDIAAQAVKIWRDKGCPKGCDDEIWLEAERQVIDQQRQRFERIETGGTLPISAFNADNLMQELDELFPSPAGQGVITSL